MSNISMVMQTAIKTSLRMRSVVLVSIGVVLICVVGVAAIFATQFIGPGVNKATPDQSALENFFGLILFTTSFISIGIFASVNAFQSLTREKSRGNIQALLATPLAPGDIWLGKSLAVFLPGFVFAVIMTIAAFLVLNFIYFVPKIGFILTPWMLISNLIAVPLVYLSLMLLVHEIGLAGKPTTANVITQIFLPVMIALMINLAVRDVMNAGSWLFTVVLFGLALVIGFFVLKLRSTLSVERIILSQ
jgi:ABC-2 type transport system permease protein